MAILNKAAISTLRLGSLLLVASLVATCSYGQDAISPVLGPPLTDNPDSTPTTTLAIDLLLPQRPFIADPTGASVGANAFDPSIYASSISVAAAQTDTQLRDSSQAGRSSPYAQAAQRLGLNPPGDDSAKGQIQSPSDGSFRSALPGSGSGQLAASGDTYQSSWGGGSSFGAAPGAQSGSRSDQSSWGTGRMQADRLGGKQSDSLRSNSALNGELANTNSDGYAGGPSGAIGSNFGSRSGQTGLSSSQSGGTSSVLRSANPSQSGQLRSSSMENKPGELTHYDAASNTAPKTGGAGAGRGASGAGKDSHAAADALTFFPAAYSEPFTLGQSPFSSPGGPGELHFFSPNILAATSKGRALSLSGSKSSDSTENSLRQAFVHRHTLATSTSHYGLATHSSGSRSLSHTTDPSLAGTAKRTHLSTSVVDSGNP